MYIPYGGGGIETFSGVPSCINEMLLQGYEGMIRVFPAWPEDRDAKFENLRTYGAFLVSSERSEGKIRYIKLTSEKGRPCTLENPWGDVKVKMEKNGEKPEIMSGRLLEFETKPNEEISIKPA